MSQKNPEICVLASLLKYRESTILLESVFRFLNAEDCSVISKKITSLNTQMKKLAENPLIAMILSYYYFE